MEEIWKDVVNFKGYYIVSNIGNVKSVDRYVEGKNRSLRFQKGISMNIQENKKGYLVVILHKHGLHYQKLVHRLVAEAFIENPYDLPQVNHKDANKHNNCVENLEWITNYDNMQHAIEHNCFHDFTDKQLNAVKNNLEFANIKRRIPVAKCDNDWNIIDKYESIISAAKINNLSDSHIAQCCNGKRKSCGGYKWKRIMEDKFNE